MSISIAARATALVLGLALSQTALAAGPKLSPGPTDLHVTVLTKTSVTLAWNAPKSNSTNWWYCIQRNGSGCIRVDPPKTTFTYPLLQPGTTYNFSVITVDSRGNRSAPSNTVTITTEPDTTPPSAPVLSATSVVPTRVSLSWTASVDDTGGQVSYALVADGSPVEAGLIGFRGITLAYLQPSSTHVFQVVARDRFGNSAESNVLTVTTPAATEANAPTAPSNLRLSSETSAPEIWLDWDAASDDTNAPGELLYEVHVNGARVSTGIGNVEDIVYCQVTGENRIAVRAIDTSGNVSGFSNEIVFVC